jgi:hypothetical protein
MQKGIFLRSQYVQIFFYLFSYILNEKINENSRMNSTNDARLCRYV